jgi:DNA-binding CsgD family transcriptional regulator
MLFLEASFSSVSGGDYQQSLKIISGIFYTRLSMIIFLLAAIVCFHRLGRSRLSSICEHPLYNIAAALCFSVGILISYSASGILGLLPINLSFFRLGASLESIGFVLLLLPWVLRFETLAREFISLIVACSFLIGVLGYYSITMISNFSRVVEPLVYMALPCLSLICLHRGMSVLMPEQMETHNPVSSRQIVQAHLMTFVVVFICSAVYGYMQPIGQEAQADHKDLLILKSISFLITFLIATVIMFICARDSSRDMHNAYKISLPIILGGFLLLPFCKGIFAVMPGIVVFVGYAWFALCALIVVPVSARMIGSSLSLPFLYVFTAEASGNVAGNYLSTLLSRMVSTNNELFYEVVLILLALVLFAIGFLFDQALARIWGVGSTKQFARSEMSADENRLQSLGQVAARYALSTRECEVFLLLAQGKRANEIAEQLVISLGTTRNHIHRIYEKLGVGSYKAMIHLIQDIHRKP